MSIALSARWIPVLDGDDRARGLYRRHYSARHYRDGRNPRLFMGPGEKMVLMLASGQAVFAWRKFISDDGQDGVNCSIFRNESARLSSDLIREADALAWERWPGERLYTYINPRKVRSSNPGYCFLMAGWRHAGWTRKGLRILEHVPEGL